MNRSFPEGTRLLLWTSTVRLHLAASSEVSLTKNTERCTKRAAASGSKRSPGKARKKASEKLGDVKNNTANL
jgi:hypothetical protein